MLNYVEFAYVRAKMFEQTWIYQSVSQIDSKKMKASLQHTKYVSFFSPSPLVYYLGRYWISDPYCIKFDSRIANMYEKGCVLSG